MLRISMKQPFPMPRAVAHSRPTIRLRKAPTLPPTLPPPHPPTSRRSLAEIELDQDAPPTIPTLKRGTLPPMPIVPMMGRDPDAYLDETEIRRTDDSHGPHELRGHHAPHDFPHDPHDLDVSVSAVSEVKSALAWGPRRKSASELFDATTRRIDRYRLLQDAGLMPVGDDKPTAPTLVAPAAVVHARSTVQVAPDDLERVRRLSQTLERDSMPGLELVDSVELTQDDLVDDETVDPEPETLSEGVVLDMPQPRASVMSDPNLQAFRGNEDWGLRAPSVADDVRIEDGGRPLVVTLPSLTGETPWLGDDRARPNFSDEDELLPPAEVSFADDRSMVPDLRPESMEIQAMSPALAHALEQAQAAHAPAGAMSSGGFAPVNPSTKLRTPGQTFVPDLSSPQAFPAQLRPPTPAPFLPVFASQASNGQAPSGHTPQAFGSSALGGSSRGGVPNESGQVSMTADVRSEKSEWTAPLLFLAVLVTAVLGGYFVFGPRLVPANWAPEAAGAPVVVTPQAQPAQPAQPAQVAPPDIGRVVSPPVLQSAPVAPVPSPGPPLRGAPVGESAKLPSKPPPAPRRASAPAPKSPPAPKPTAVKPAAKAETPERSEGPRALPAPAPEPPAAPSSQGLSDLLNGAL